MVKFKGKLFIECKTDKLLVNKIGFKKCICAGGIGEVCNKLKNSRDSCGLVDEDPTKSKPSYMENLLKTSVISNDYNIVVAYDKKRNNYLIALSPDLESWLIQTAKILSINLKDFSLPNDSKELKKVMLFNPQRVEQLIDKILDSNHPRVNELLTALGRCKQ